MLHSASQLQDVVHEADGPSQPVMAHPVHSSIPHQDSAEEPLVVCTNVPETTVEVAPWHVKPQPGAVVCYVRTARLSSQELSDEPVAGPR